MLLPPLVGFRASPKARNPTGIRIAAQVARGGAPPWTGAVSHEATPLSLSLRQSGRALRGWARHPLLLIRTEVPLGL